MLTNLNQPGSLCESGLFFSEEAIAMILRNGLFACLLALLTCLAGCGGDKKETNLNKEKPQPPAVK